MEKSGKNSRLKKSQNKRLKTIQAFEDDINEDSNSLSEDILVENKAKSKAKKNKM